MRSYMAMEKITEPSVEFVNVGKWRTNLVDAMQDSLDHKDRMDSRPIMVAENGKRVTTLWMCWHDRPHNVMIELADVPAGAFVCRDYPAKAVVLTPSK